MLGFLFDYIFLFLLLIIILVFVHELGHYLVARFFGVYIESFSIGFGKELIGWTDKKGTRWKISAIPLGGYVKMKGEMIPSSTENTIKDTDSFESKNLFAKFCIVFAGPLFNLIFPIIILFNIFLLSGNPTYTNKIGYIAENSPASKHLELNDEIIEINNTKIENFNDIKSILSNLPNKTISIIIKRQDSIINKNITTTSTVENNKEIGLLGIGPNKEIKEVNYSVPKAFKDSIILYVDIFKQIKDGLIKLFSGNISLNDVGGPVKISQFSADSAKYGIGSWFLMMALFSINLAIINLFPIPALDGGHLILYIIQAITRKKISSNVLITLNKIGVYFLISLMVFILSKDIIELFYKI